MIRFVPENWRGTYCGRQKTGLRRVASTPAILQQYQVFMKHIGDPRVLQMRMNGRECLS